MMSSLITDCASVKQKLDTLTNQASTGLIGDTYAGLGTGASVSLDLRPQIANMQTWQNNIKPPPGTMEVTQTAMTQIQSIASNFYAQLNNLDGVNSSEVDSIAAHARDALSAGRRPAGYPGWRRLRVRRPGHRQSAGARSRQHPDLRLLHPDQHRGRQSRRRTAPPTTANATLASAASNAAGTSPFST